MTSPTQPIDIAQLEAGQFDRALHIINAAAQWYASFLPPQERSAPEMNRAQFMDEAVRMHWYGAFCHGALIGVMGLEPKFDAYLIRHAYVAQDAQRAGVGSILLAHLESQCPAGALLIAGTYAANTRAEGLFVKSGYRRSHDPATRLKRYYTISAERFQSSLTYEKRLPVARA